MLKQVPAWKAAEYEATFKCQLAGSWLLREFRVEVDLAVPEVEGALPSLGRVGVGEVSVVRGRRGL